MNELSIIANPYSDHVSVHWIINGQHIHNTRLEPIVWKALRNVLPVSVKVDERELIK